VLELSTKGEVSAPFFFLEGSVRVFIDKSYRDARLAIMKKKARLILGGGAAYGLAHIGCLEVLREQFEITGIVGTSMGAIVGALYAAGREPRDILKLARVNKYMLIFNPLAASFFRARVPLGSLWKKFKPDLLIQMFQEWTEGKSIEDLPIRYIAVAYDLHKQISVLLDKGSLAQAMRASSSLPVVFQPFTLGEYLLVDGGVEHPLPVAFGENVPGEITIAINVLPPVSVEAEHVDLETKGEQQHLLPHQVFIQSILQNQGFVAIQAMLQKPPDLFIDAYDPSKKMFAWSDAQDFFDYGVQAAEKALNNYEEPGFMSRYLKMTQALVGKFLKVKQI
jgi:NTE family protein